MSKIGFIASKIEPEGMFEFLLRSGIIEPVNPEDRSHGYRFTYMEDGRPWNKSLAKRELKAWYGYTPKAHGTKRLNSTFDRVTQEFGIEWPEYLRGNHQYRKFRTHTIYDQIQEDLGLDVSVLPDWDKRKLGKAFRRVKYHYIDKEASLAHFMQMIDELYPELLENRHIAGSKAETNSTGITIPSNRITALDLAKNAKDVEIT